VQGSVTWRFLDTIRPDIAAAPDALPHFAASSST